MTAALDTEQIRAALRRVEKVTPSRGNTRFVAEPTADGHADRFWALALALHAGSNPTAPIEFMSGGPRASSLPLGDFIHG